MGSLQCFIFAPVLCFDKKIICSICSFTCFNINNFYIIIYFFKIVGICKDQINDIWISRSLLYKYTNYNTIIVL